MKLTILGNNSALPAFGRHPTAQAISLYGEVILIDCGEGTQSQMQRYGIRWRSIHHIFISHLHGDHFFGLPGLLTSMSLLGRTSPVYLYGPAELEGILETILRVGATSLAYPFHFYPLGEGRDLLVDNPYFKLTSFPVDHRIPCHGVLVEKKTKGRKLLPEKCKDAGISPEFFEALKSGQDYITESGELIPNHELTADGPPPKKYAYCADTRYCEGFLDLVEGADAIYHESTYLEADAEKAVARFHSTARQAAELALKAGAKQLYLGHFSSKYRETEPFQEEARSVFPETCCTVEGITYDI
jgi:ribonuclease Z